MPKDPPEDLEAPEEVVTLILRHCDSKEGKEGVSAEYAVIRPVVGHAPTVA